MRFGVPRFAVDANNVVRRKYCHTLSILTVHGSRTLLPSGTASFIRKFSSAQPSPQKET